MPLSSSGPVSIMYNPHKRANLPAILHKLIKIIYFAIRKQIEPIALIFILLLICFVDFLLI